MFGIHIKRYSLHNF